jgi:hypothetical protein
LGQGGGGGEKRGAGQQDGEAKARSGHGGFRGRIDEAIMRQSQPQTIDRRARLHARRLWAAVSACSGRAWLGFVPIFTVWPCGRNAALLGAGRLEPAIKGRGMDGPRALARPCGASRGGFRRLRTPGYGVVPSGQLSFYRHPHTVAKTGVQPTSAQEGKFGHGFERKGAPARLAYGVNGRVPDEQRLAAGGVGSDRR